jgi:hypothetical protein
MTIWRRSNPPAFLSFLAPVALVALVALASAGVVAGCDSSSTSSPNDGGADAASDAAPLVDGQRPETSPDGEPPKHDGAGQDSAAHDGAAGDTGGGGQTTKPGSVPTPDYEALCKARSHANCYYVSSTGNYPAGTSGRQLTIAEVSTRSFSPGDMILFARGDSWRQTGSGALITVNASGTAQDNLIFAAYGTGPKPRLLGSIAASSWTHAGGNVWRSATPIPKDPHSIDSGAEVFFERSDGSALFGHRESSEGGLDRPGDWTFANNAIAVYASADPSTLYTSVEVPQAQRLIHLDNKQHLTFDSLTLRYMVNAGFYDRYANAAGLLGLRVTNCEIGYIGVKNSTSAYGLSLERSSITIAGNTIHDCGRRGVSLVLYNNTSASVIRDVVIAHNHFYNGYHTTGVDMQAYSASGGTHLIENVTIRANLFEGDPSYDIKGEDGSPSNHVFVKEVGSALIRDVTFANNVVTFPHGSGVKTQGGEKYLVVNNTFYGFNPTYDNYQAHIATGSAADDVTIVNNLFVNDVTDSRYAHVQIRTGRQSEYTVDRNIYHPLIHAHARLLWVDGGTSHFFDSSWSAYRAATGFDANSPKPPTDPQLVNPPSDLRPKSTSPAVGLGSPFAWNTTDYFGAARSDPPDIGAIQH